MTVPQDLIERVKAATGPDRELDAMLYVRLFQGREWRDDGQVVYAQASPKDAWRVGYSGEGGFRFSELSVATMVATYTASIDAALALAERVLPGHMAGFEPGLGGIAHGKIIAVSKQMTQLVTRAKAPTAPLAIVLATLLALQSSEQSK